MKLQPMQFAVSGGILGAFCFAWITLAALIGVPGFLPFAKLLQDGYSFYGYALSWSGIFVGTLWGFVEGFIWFGLFSLLYNRLLKK